MPISMASCEESRSRDSNRLPLKQEAILEFRKGKRGWLFNTSDIEQF
jgi:hypothetical protein